MSNTIKNYYYVGINEEYGLYIIKKINPQYLDRNTTLTWNLLYIWNDVNYRYKKLSKICSKLHINMSSVKKDYILININFTSFGGRTNENNFKIFQACLSLINKIRTSNIKEFKIYETETLHRRIDKIKSTIIDTNVISVINQYSAMSRLDKYIEIAHYENNIPRVIMRFIMENCNIYKICNMKNDGIYYYFAQKDDLFYECDAFGIPLRLKFSTNSYSMSNLFLDIGYNSIGSVDVKINDGLHNNYTCLLNCPEKCKIRKIIKNKFITGIKFITGTEIKNLRIAQFDKQMVGYYINITQTATGNFEAVKKVDIKSKVDAENKIEDNDNASSDVGSDGDTFY